MQPKQILLAWIDAFNRADVKSLIELYHDDAINQQVANEPVHGKDAISSMFEQEFAAAADMVCIPENIFESRSHVCLRCIMSVYMMCFMLIFFSDQAA